MCSWKRQSSDIRECFRPLHNLWRDFSHPEIAHKARDEKLRSLTPRQAGWKKSNFHEIFVMSLVCSCFRIILELCVFYLLRLEFSRWEHTNFLGRSRRKHTFYSVVCLPNPTLTFFFYAESQSKTMAQPRISTSARGKFISTRPSSERRCRNNGKRNHFSR